MTHSNSWWIVTDLDGTLLDHSYSWEPARTTLRWLQEQEIPVIPCTSKTAEEVRGFRDAAGLRDPFIVETVEPSMAKTPTERSGKRPSASTTAT